MPLLWTSFQGASGGVITPPPEPIYETVGETATGAGSNTSEFQANDIFAQRYTCGFDGKIVSVPGYVPNADTATMRGAVYANSAGLPGALLAATPDYVVSGAGPQSGWVEFELDPADYVDVLAADIVWIAVHSNAAKDSRSNTSVQSGRRFKGATFASGPPNPFGTASTYSNTRGIRFKIWTNPP